MDSDATSGNEPPADGMHIAVRLRRDFTITDAKRLLASARAAYIELNPGTTDEYVAEMVTSAADAIFTILEHRGLIGHAADAALASYGEYGEYGEYGLDLGGRRAQVTLNERRRLPPGPDCLDQGDVFTLPADA